MDFLSGKAAGAGQDQALKDREQQLAAAKAAQDAKLAEEEAAKRAGLRGARSLIAKAYEAATGASASGAGAGSSKSDTLA